MQVQAEEYSYLLIQWSDATTVQMRMTSAQAVADLARAKVRRAQPPKLEWRPLDEVYRFIKHEPDQLGDKCVTN